MKSSLIFSLQIRPLISVNRIWMIVVCILIGSACEMPNSKEIQQRRLALNSKDETKRLQAIYELGQMRKKAKIATQDLINIMNDETELLTIRNYAHNALGQIDPSNPKVKKAIEEYVQNSGVSSTILTP